MSELYENPVRIAMWSGPRNLSTAMMRSFGARADTLCVDEPFYAGYLKLTGLEHPMRAEILVRHEADPVRVADDMSAAPTSSPIFYQKHMAHHMVDGISRHWMSHVQNVFLIRHPARVLASYARKMETVSLSAIGFDKQFQLFEFARDATGDVPIIVDSDDILRDPRSVLSALCDRLGIDFDEAMLSWPAGPRKEDGAWAPHWYDTVSRSTRFGDVQEGLPQLRGEYQTIHDEALEIYDALANLRIRPAI